MAGYGLVRRGGLRYGLSTAGCSFARECILMRSASNGSVRSALSRLGMAWRGMARAENSVEGF